mmetsp:Transcript_485/g.1368  ORF Transcript_485/g.1368 Transcript_485/m.1368 type:complete len:225 (-) Transcript_485:22-696(-)
MKGPSSARGGASSSGRARTSLRGTGGLLARAPGSVGVDSAASPTVVAGTGAGGARQRRSAGTLASLASPPPPAAAAPASPAPISRVMESAPSPRQLSRRSRARPPGEVSAAHAARDADSAPGTACSLPSAGPASKTRRDRWQSSAALLGSRSAWTAMTAAPASRPRSSSSDRVKIAWKRLAVGLTAWPPRRSRFLLHAAGGAASRRTSGAARAAAQRQASIGRS